MPDNKEQYKRIVEDHLQITRAFLDEHKTTIQDRLLDAHSEMVKTERGGDDPPKLLLQDTIYGINHCIHLASSLALLGSVGHTRDAVQYVHKDRKLSHIDPTTVLTIATLHYIIKDYLLGHESKNGSGRANKKIFEEICRSFDTVNWMIGEAAMNALGIESKAKTTH